MRHILDRGQDNFLGVTRQIHEMIDRRVLHLTLSDVEIGFGLATD